MNPLTEHEKVKRREALKAAGGAVDTAWIRGQLIPQINEAVSEDKPGGLLGMHEHHKRATRAINFIASQPWAITAEALELIDGIAHRANESPEAVATKLGRPLQGTRTMEMRNNIAVLPVSGPIFRYANIFTEISGASSIEMMALDFQTALDDPKVDAIVLDIDSPGGMVAGVSEFADMVHASDKPVTAYVGALAASAAYWIAAAADDIVLDKSAEVGSVGAVMQMRINADKNSREIVSSQSPNKRPNPDSDDGRTELQGRIDALAQVFIESVADFRGVDAETVINGFGRGGMKLGEAAVQAGMADRLGSLESTIAGMSGGTERSGLMDATIKTSEITRDYIAAEHPAIADAFRKEGEDKAKAENSTAGQASAEAERERIKAVLDVGSGTDHEALANTLAFDGVTTAAEAALKILAADKEARGNKIEDLRKDAPDPVVSLVDSGDAGSAGIDPSLPIEERAKAAWANDPKIRAEFVTEEDYVAWAKADDAGRVKQMGKAS
jgi:ClpP class serine protease